MFVNGLQARGDVQDLVPHKASGHALLGGPRRDGLGDLGLGVNEVLDDLVADGGELGGEVPGVLNADLPVGEGAAVTAFYGTD